MDGQEWTAGTAREAGNRKAQATSKTLATYDGGGGGGGEMLGHGSSPVNSQMASVFALTAHSEPVWVSQAPLLYTYSMPVQEASASHRS
eukprot:scaffold385194_cov45-Prasinocladus_malaysianus.AAC.1